jgi:hypothetical protein
MHLLLSALQILVALGLLNVWVLRFRQSTAYRGGDASSMKEEFAYYGLPDWLMYVVGALKVAIAVCLVAGVWFPPLVLPAGLLLCVLMLGALAMHGKVRDPLKKSLPALAVLGLSVAICWLAMRYTA